MIVLLVSGLVGMFLWQATNPPDIAVDLVKARNGGDVELHTSGAGRIPREHYSLTHNDNLET